MPDLPRRAIDILAKPPEPESKWKKTGLMGGATVLSGGGIAVLGYTHLEWLTPLLPDLAGGLMLTLGGGMAVAAARLPSGDASQARKKRESDYANAVQMEIVPLNEDVRYAQAADRRRGG